MAPDRDRTLAWHAGAAGRGGTRLSAAAAEVLIALALVVPVGALALRRGFDGLYGQDPYAYYAYAVGPLRAALLTLSRFRRSSGRPVIRCWWRWCRCWSGRRRWLGKSSVRRAAHWPRSAARDSPRSLAASKRGVEWSGGGGRRIARGNRGARRCAPGSGRCAWPSPRARALRGRSAELAAPRAADSLARGGQQGCSVRGEGGPTVMGLHRPPMHHQQGGYGLGRVWGPLPAGLLVALCGQVWQSSIVVMADTSGMAAATLGAWALVRYGHGGRGGGLALAGAALAFACVSRWIYGLVAVPCALYALWALWRRPESAALRHAGPAAVATAAVLLPVLCPPRAACSPRAVTSAHSAAMPRCIAGARPTCWRAASRPATAGRIHPPQRAVLRAAARRGLVLDAAVRGAGTAGDRAGDLAAQRGRPAARRLDRGGDGFHAGAPWQNVRFGLAYLPPLAVLAALAADWLARRGGQPGRWLTFGLLGVGLLWMALGGARLTRDFVARKDQELALIRWVDGQVPSRARLLAFGDRWA